MNPTVAIGVTIAILAGLWTALSESLGLVTWAAFITWALFFAAGGKVTGVAKVIPPALTGVLYGVIALAAAAALPTAITLPLSVAVVAFAMCMQSLWSPLSMIPAAFSGCAAVFAGAGAWLGIGISLIIGALLGWVSESSATLMAKKPEPELQTA